MNIDYGNNRLKKQLSNASEIKKAFGEMAKKISQRLNEMAASPNLAVLIQIPAANCHPLTGNRSGEWAVNISGNHRLIFEINHDPLPIKDDGSVNTLLVTDIRLMSTEDYH
jgi:plasmid maintenance system killer protein